MALLQAANSLLIDGRICDEQLYRCAGLGKACPFVLLQSVDAEDSGSVF